MFSIEWGSLLTCYRILHKPDNFLWSSYVAAFDHILPAAIFAGLLGLLLITGCQDRSESQQRVLVLGLITNNPNGMRNVEGFKGEMTRLGYEEGSKIRYIYSGKPTSSPELESTIQSFLASKVDLIFTAGTPTGVVAYQVTRDSDVPVVFGVIANPIAAGVMSDLNQPGGNITGVKLSQSQARRFEIFTEMVPVVRRILVPFNPTDTAPTSAVAQISDIAKSLNIELVIAEARKNDDVTQLLADFPDVDAIFLVPDTTVNRRLAEILDLAEQRRIPVSGPSVAQVEAGALMTYGFIHQAAGAQAARMADRILRGAEPATTPVETAEIFLQLNTASAARIGIQVSDDLLQRADVILRTDKRSDR